MVIGFRCSNSDYSYAILDGDKKNPKIITSNTTSFPKNFERQDELKWFYQELDDLFKKYQINSIGIKGAEVPGQNGNSFICRVENEAMIFLCASNNGITKISRKVKATIAKNLCSKGRAKYLQTELNLYDIENYTKSSDKINEAILVAWSNL
jgi:Holliday junction resolvasome RuvABC endonuclease subunit